MGQLSLVASLQITNVHNNEHNQLHQVLCEQVATGLFK